MGTGRVKKAYQLINLHVGIALVAVNIHFFLAPNQFAAGGLGGLTIVMHHFYPNASIGLFMLLFNILFFGLGFLFLGFSVGLKTIYSSFMLSFLVWLFGKVAPMTQPLSDDKLIQLIVGVLIAALGLVFVMKEGASTGGMDLIGMILNKYFSIDIGKAVLFSDIIIVLLSILAFGIENGLYSLFGIVLRGVVIDYLIQQFSLTKEVVIISYKCDLIKQFIISNLGRSATIHQAKGVFTNEQKEVITIVLKRNEFNSLKKYIKEVDQRAFISVHNMAEVVGNGFKSII
jgi:uncharacterized membrane-anchored protein YitT (DUF2179 family)